MWCRYYNYRVLAMQKKVVYRISFIEALKTILYQTPKFSNYFLAKFGLKIGKNCSRGSFSRKTVFTDNLWTAGFPWTVRLITKKKHLIFQYDFQWSDHINEDHAVHTRYYVIDRRHRGAGRVDRVRSESDITCVSGDGRLVHVKWTLE